MADSEAVVLRKNGIEADCRRIDSSELKSHKDLIFFACKHFITDVQPYDLDLDLLTTNGVEPIDSNLWNEGFYFQKAKDESAGIVTINAHLTPIKHPEHSNHSGPDFPTTADNIQKGLQAMSERQIQKEKSRRNVRENREKSPKGKSLLDPEENLRTLHLKLANLQSDSAESSKQPDEAKRDNKTCTNSFRRRLSESNDPDVPPRPYNPGPETWYTGTFGPPLHPAPSKALPSPGITSPRPDPDPFRREQQPKSPPNITINFHFQELFSLPASGAPLPPLLKKQVPPLAAVYPDDTRESQVLGYANAHFEKFSHLTRGGVNVKYLLEMHSKVVILGSRDWMLKEYMDKTAPAHTSARSYMHRCMVLVSRRIQKD